MPFETIGKNGHVTVPDGTTALEAGAFWCKPVFRVTLPASVATIAPRTFAYHATGEGEDLRPQASVYIDVDASNPRYQSSGGSLFTKGSAPTLLCAWYEDVADTFGAQQQTGLVFLSVPEGVRRLAPYSIPFASAHHRLVLALPQTLETIDAHALCDQRIAHLSIGPDLKNVACDFWTNVSDDDAATSTVLKIRKGTRVTVHPRNRCFRVVNGHLHLPWTGTEGTHA